MKVIQKSIGRVRAIEFHSEPSAPYSDYDFENAVDRAIGIMEGDKKDLAVGFDRAGFLPMVALRQVARIICSAKERGKRLGIAGLPPNLRRIMEESDGGYHVFRTLEEAVCFVSSGNNNNSRKKRKAAPR